MSEQASPRPPPPPDDPGDRLDSWKEIAAYLRRGVTTAQRWEQQEGLPIHRLPHEKRGSVYAFKTELDRWWQNGRHRLEADADAEADFVEPRTGWPAGWVVGLAIAALALGSLAWLYLSRPKPERRSRPMPLTALPGRERAPALSWDGRQVAFVWDGGNAAAPAQLYVKLVGLGDPLQLTRGPASVEDPAWSPDGSEVAFLRRNGEGGRDVVVSPALGGPERKLGTTRCSQNGLSWSPDGTLLVLPDKLSPREPDGLFLLSTATGEKRRLTSAPRAAAAARGDSGPSFSPDGRTVAFLRREAFAGPDIYLVSVGEGQGEEPRRLVGDFRWISSVDWSADGRSLVFAGGARAADGLWRVLLRGGEPELLSADLGEGPEDISIARTGTRLVYSKSMHDANIWRVKGPNGTEALAPTRLIASSRGDRDPVYSPDGTRIAFRSDRSGRPQIWACASDGTDCRQLTVEDGMDARWSPDGEQIAFSCGLLAKALSVCVVSAQGGFPRRLTADAPDGRSWGPTWSHDGRWIYFTRRGGRPALVRIWRIPAGGGEPQQVTKDGGISGQESMDGRLVYYTKRPGGEGAPIWQVPREGGQEALVLDKRPHWKNWTIWKDSIVYLDPEGASGPTIEQFDLKTRTVTEIAALGMDTQLDNGLSVSPDGRWILYARDDLAGSDLMLIEGFR
jgi:Tol biopolymer transport system component